MKKTLLTVLMAGLLMTPVKSETLRDLNIENITLTAEQRTFTGQKMDNLEPVDPNTHSRIEGELIVGDNSTVEGFYFPPETRVVVTGENVTMTNNYFDNCFLQYNGSSAQEVMFNNNIHDNQVVGIRLTKVLDGQPKIRNSLFHNCGYNIYSTDSNRADMGQILDKGNNTFYRANKLMKLVRTGYTFTAVGNSWINKEGEILDTEEDIINDIQFSGQMPTTPTVSRSADYKDIEVLPTKEFKFPTTDSSYWTMYD